MTHLHQQIHSMGLGDHSCLIYESFEEQMAAAIPFIQVGLERNEACVYIADDCSQAEIQEAFTVAGIDVRGAIESGALVIASKRESYVRSGTFDPQKMIEFLESFMKESIDKGFTGFRVTGEMTWALGKECACEHLVEYEARLNKFFPGNKVVAICQYNKKKFGAEIIRDVLRTHPVAILGNQVCTNLYYETPEMVLGQESVDGKVDWMIQQLRSFRTTEQRLEKSVQMRDDFLSVASHELRTPLTALKFQNDMYRESLNEGEPTMSREEYTELIELNHRQIHQLTKLVDDMLDISRMAHGDFLIERKPMDLSQLVEEAVAELGSSNSGLEIRVEAKNGVYGQWDTVRIQQVVMNLLSNARKYGDGKPIDVKLDKVGEEAVLTVRDRGIGIDPGNQSRIFEQFERAVPGRHISGLGLGLFICKKIADAHGGAIEVESAKGKGSTFRLRLPMVSEMTA